MKAKFIFDRETKGTLLFKEVDSSGAIVSMHDAQIGSLYIRKNSEVGAKKPQIITVEVLPA